MMQIAFSNAVPNLSKKITAAFPMLAGEVQAQDLIRIEADEPIRVGPLVRFLEGQGAEVMEARRLRPSLEDVFVRITGIEAEAMRKEKEKAGGSA
jgi:ABC-2 type transport system ATP-binding protein